ncbi:maleylpyruvate isomerase N-terminal domain-containing protein [Frankia sp. Mgl5]|uniref:maleylpyruvate isomerase N-terminal domain-containing protein n=1 Tax=Frankia sp. Mgl5 TaxID=2933793 RepID=UPI0020103A30|nr:maleylpyruvate isomerase N-terminal domain-containing protein [Frankia sp. Mgl5]MCK9928406.1 maleylpyruvate isomerase N-terminal domain-containing protein [Frankia sp. Mgl5]
MTVDPTAAPTPEHCVTALLDAYVVGECTAAEADAIETHLGRCVSCSVDAAQLALTVAPPAWSAAGPPDAPAADVDMDLTPGRPGSLDAVLAAALAARPAAPGTVVAGLTAAAQAGPARPRGPRTPTHGSRAAALDRLLAELAPEHWGRPAAAGWSVRELVLHLYAVDGLLLAALDGAGSDTGTGSDAPGDLGRPDEDPVARTEAVLAATREWSVEQVRLRWFERAGLVCAAVADATRASGPSAVTAGGWTTTPADHLTARAFETWIHTRDIAAAAGLAVPDPGGDELHTMADLALRLLADPWTAVVETAGPAALTVTLTGPGGGTWSLDPSGVHEWENGAGPVEPGPAADLARTTGPASGPLTAGAVTVGAVTVGAVTAGIVPFCLLAGDRATVDAVATRMEGDERLAVELLALAPSLAGP